jgi:hypothetical protein
MKERKAMVARALECECDLLARTSLEVCEINGHRFVNQPVDLEPPCTGIDHWPVKVRNGEEFVIGSNPGIEILPNEL